MTVTPDSPTPDGPTSPGRGPRPQVGMLLYPGLTLLDLLGPQTALSMVMDVHLIWTRVDEPVVTDTGLRIFPTVTLSECPPALDVVFVPGGPGMNAVLRDRAVLEFLARHGASARWVTSVCSGSIVLGAAGLLRGYRATSHWAALELLPVVGAEPVSGRVVVDRNRITAGGVTAGIDFALTLIAGMLGDQAAKLVQLGMEYDPHPPFDAGHPARPDASPELVAMARAVTAQVGADSLAALADLGFGVARAHS